MQTNEKVMSDPTARHSKLPWRLESNGRSTSIRCPSAFHDHIESCPDLGDPGNAALIVRAVNAHQALVYALRRIAGNDGMGAVHPSPSDHLRAIASEALALATKE